MTNAIACLPKWIRHPRVGGGPGESTISATRTHVRADARNLWIPACAGMTRMRQRPPKCPTD
jgi:hypothetical protein